MPIEQRFKVKGETTENIVKYKIVRNQKKRKREKERTKKGEK